jgi:putative membrane protein
MSDRDEPPPAHEPPPRRQPERRPESVYGVGDDPDVRFSLANERTALAWIRTGVGLVGGGIALTSFAAFADLSTVLDVVAACACLGGGVLALYALIAWRRNERAIRLRLPLPPPSALPALVIGLVVFAVAIAGYALWSGSTR